MEKQITLPIPMCECGVQGDLIIVMLNADIDHIWCTVCGKRLSSNKPLDSDAKEPAQGSQSLGDL